MSSVVLQAMRARLIDWACTGGPRAPVPEKAQLFGSLADPLQLRILDLVAGRPRSVPEIARAIDESVVGAAAHLAHLEACGLVHRVSREGERRYAATDVINRLVRAADAVLAGRRPGLRSGTHTAE